MQLEADVEMAFQDDQGENFVCVSYHVLIHNKPKE